MNCASTILNPVGASARLRYAVTGVQKDASADDGPSTRPMFTESVNRAPVNVGRVGTRPTNITRDGARC